MKQHRVIPQASRVRQARAAGAPTDAFLKARRDRRTSLLTHSSIERLEVLGSRHDTQLPLVKLLALTFSADWSTEGIMAIVTEEDVETFLNSLRAAGEFLPQLRSIRRSPRQMWTRR